MKGRKRILKILDNLEKTIETKLSTSCTDTLKGDPCIDCSFQEIRNFLNKLDEEELPKPPEGLYKSETENM